MAKDLKKILILRMSSAGDVIHGLPTAAALKRLLPGCETGWLVEDRFCALLQNNPAVDRLHVLPRREWKKWGATKKLGAIRKVISEIKDAGYDACLDLQGLSKSALAGWLAGIKTRVGFAGRDGREISRLLNSRTVEATCAHVVDRNMELLAGLGVEAENTANGEAPFWTEFPLPCLDSDRIESFLQDNKLGHKKFIALNPGAGWDAKKWTTARFAEVAKIVAGKSGLPIVITWGGAAEEKMAREIKRESDIECMLAPATNLIELWALLAQARLYIGLDTGPSHMAAASGTDTVAVFGPTSGIRNGPRGGSVKILQGKCIQHPKCWKKRYRASCTCMEKITAGEVAEACLSLLTETE